MDVMRTANLSETKIAKRSAIQNVGVIGAGQMGSGIAQVSAQSGFNVTLADVSEDALTR